MNIGDWNLVGQRLKEIKLRNKKVVQYETTIESTQFFKD